MFAYEALARSRLFGLDKPAQMFQAAEYFHMEAELSRMLRREELTTTCATDAAASVFEHASLRAGGFQATDLSLREIRAARRGQPLTLEVHEAAAADLATMKMLRLVLDDLNMKLAYDDFGAGQARLNELVEARPDFVKFDRKIDFRTRQGRRQPPADDRIAGQHVPPAWHRHAGRGGRDRTGKRKPAVQWASS